MPTFTLDPRDEDFIRRQVESGRYDNASDVIEAGLRLLRDMENTREAWLEETGSRAEELRSKPEIGIPADAVFSRLQERHRSRLKKAG